MTYNSYVNKGTKACDLNVKVIYDIDIKVLYCKHSDFQVGRDYISHDRKYSSHVNLDLEPRTLKVELARDIIIHTNALRYIKIH